MKLATHRKHQDRFRLEVEVPYENEDEALALAALGSHTGGGETTFVPEDGTATVRFHWPPAPEGMKQKDWIAMQRREAKLLIEHTLSEASDTGTKVQGEGGEL